MICLPLALHASFCHENGPDTCTDVRPSLVTSLSKPGLGRLTAIASFSPGAFSARHHCSCSDESSPLSAVSSFQHQNTHARSCNVAVSCASFLHAETVSVRTRGSASRMDVKHDISDNKAFSDHHVSHLSLFEEASGSTSEEPSTYEAFLAGSSKSLQSFPSSLSSEGDQLIGDHHRQQIPSCGPQEITAVSSLKEAKLCTFTQKTDSATALLIPSSEGMHLGLAPFSDRENWHEDRSLTGISYLDASVPDAWGLRIIGDQGDPMAVSVYAGAEVLKCHSSDSGDRVTDSQAVLKETKHAHKMPCGGTNSVSALRLPVYRIPGGANRSSNSTENILYLDSLGVDSSRVFREEPMVLTYKTERLRQLVHGLEGIGLHWSDLGKIINLCPRIIHLSPVKDIKLVINFLCDEVGLRPKGLHKVIKRCPRMLASDVDEQLWPMLMFLRTLGLSDMGQVVASSPNLLCLDLQTGLIPKLEYLESLGFTNGEVVSMADRFPALFNYNMKEVLQPKYEYLVHKMGGSNRELLVFPQYFGYSLTKRIKPRHACIERQGVSLSLQAMLRLSEAEFSAKFHDERDLSKQDASGVELCECA